MIFVSYLEDLPLRVPVVLGRYTYGAEEIKAFARTFDPQGFHMDEAAAARSHFGRLCTSGWHSVAGWMRAAVAHRQAMAEERRRQGKPVAGFGPSPGFRDLSWLKPVYVGDTITYAAEVLETRPSNSRPGWGLANYFCTGTNQNGDVALSFISICFIERRPGVESAAGSRPGPSQ